MKHPNHKSSNLTFLPVVYCVAMLYCNIAEAQDLSDDISTITQSERIIRFIEQEVMPIARVGGGIRGTEGGDIVFTVLAPEQTGLTTQAQPTLYWYQSEPAENMQFELTLNSGDETIFDIQRDQALDSGIQRINLEDMNISLEPDVSYEWIIALIPDPDDRAKDITSSTVIQRTGLTDDLNSKLQQASPAEHPYFYAEAGIWYDALDSLARALGADPDNETLIMDRIKLFEQVGLHKVAELEHNQLSDN